MNIPHPLPALYWMWRQRSLDIRPWEAAADDLPLDGARIAIVGNAGYLSELSQGELIDRHDLVIRMNNFRTSGFESAVGSRIDIYMSNFYVPDIDFTNPDIGRARFVVSSRPNTFKKPRTYSLDLRYGEHLTEGLHRIGAERAYVPSLSYIRGLTEQLHNTPTTGTMAILLATDVLLARAASVYVTGFSFFEGNTHYFQDTTSDLQRFHNVTSEKTILAERLRPLLDAGRATLDETVAQHLDVESSQAANLPQ